MGVRLASAMHAITKPYEEQVTIFLEDAKRYFTRHPNLPLVIMRLPNSSKKFKAALMIIAERKQWDYIVEPLFLSRSKVVVYADKDYWEHINS